jgi:hypothetical protein
VPGRIANHRDALVERPDGSLVRDGSHTHNELVAQSGTAFNHINMPIGNRVKRSRIDDYIHVFR